MKSTALAYVLWFFLGGLGIHKFYVGKNVMGIVYLLCSMIGWLTVKLLIGFIPLGLVGMLWFIDLFTLPSQVRRANREAAKAIAEFQLEVESVKADL